MPRYPHHIVQRGHNRKTVFVTDDDRLAYLATLREFREQLGLQVHGYCLMTNHIHLIVNPGDDATHLSLLMKRLAGRHTRRINRLAQRTGTAWEGRWSSYRARIGLVDCPWLDFDPCYIALASTPEQRQRRYGEFVAGGIPKPQIEFLRAAVQRNQLTGSDAFVLEVEQRIGTRIPHRAPGRPSSAR